MNRIQTFREEARLSQSQLGAACGWGKTSQSRVSNYENDVRTPSLDDMRAIVSALSNSGVECSLDDVFPPKKGHAA